MRWHGTSGDQRAKKPTRRQVQLGALVAVAIAVLLAAWVLIDDNDSGNASTDTIEAQIVSVAALRRTAAAGSVPIYWAGETAGTELELSRPAPDRTYVRYLPPGTEAGAEQRFLTVGSYELEDPTTTLRERGEEPDGVLATAPGNGTVYFSRDDPKSVYLAYPGSEVEVEVFAPEFKEALELVTSGRVVPAG